MWRGGAFWRPAAPARAAPPAAAAGAAAGPAAALALFLTESRRDVKPRSNMFLEVVPSFSSMVFRGGEGCLLEACSTSSSSTTSSGSLVDYHCRAPFRPSVPWCFPVREVRLFKAICWLKDVANSCSSCSRSSAAATTKVAAEQLTAGAG